MTKLDVGRFGVVPGHCAVRGSHCVVRTQGAQGAGLAPVHRELDDLPRLFVDVLAVELLDVAGLLLQEQRAGGLRDILDH
eukprot:794302-Lingulodinium_polyedra.AAC.1